MTVVPLDRLPIAGLGDDLAIVDAQNDTGAPAFGRALGDAFASAGSALERAAATESAFAAHRGGLQEMVLERARADVALSLASATASRAAQALTTLLGMQV